MNSEPTEIFVHSLATMLKLEPPHTARCWEQTMVLSLHDFWGASGGSLYETGVGGGGGTARQLDKAF